jgi:hypothetical protein
VRGTLVGGRLKATTALGELAIRIEDLTLYRAADPVAAPPPTGSGAPPAPAPAPAETAPAPVTAPPPAAPRPASPTGKCYSPADWIQEGLSAFGETIWEGMKEIGRAVESVFKP